MLTPCYWRTKGLKYQDIIFHEGSYQLIRLKRKSSADYRSPQRTFSCFVAYITKQFIKLQIMCRLCCLLKNISAFSPRLVLWWGFFLFFYNAWFESNHKRNLTNNMSLCVYGGRELIDLTGTKKNVTKSGFAKLVAVVPLTTNTVRTPHHRLFCAQPHVNIKAHRGPPIYLLL